MRSIFNQYKQQENQLTHALACCFHEDRLLLDAFLRWIGAPKPSGTAKELVVLQQSLPGDAVVDDTEGGDARSGLPDIVIHDGAEWCVPIESKVKAPLVLGQLQRHRATLNRRNFTRVHMVALTKSDAHYEGVHTTQWTHLYQWLAQHEEQSQWAVRMRHFLREAEVRFVRERYLDEGTLTMFDGFRFTPENPYTYGEGKRLLKLALAELRADSRLRDLGMDPDAPGRGAITGSGGSAVWDYLSLKDRPKNTNFTKHPHLTLGVHHDHLEVALTIPNGIQGEVRRRFISLGSNDFVRLNGAVLRAASRLTAQGATVFANCEQRHFPSQRSAGIEDAVLKFNLETSQPKPRDGAKHQPQWVELFAQIAGQKRSNLQFQYRINIPWKAEGLKSGESSINLIVDGWCALKPILNALRDETE